MSENIQVGNIRMEFLRSKHDTGGSLDLMRMTVPPGGQMPVAHYHRDWDETVYGLDGTITFEVDGAAHAVGAGDTLFIKRGIVHGFDNRSGADAICLAALTPGVLGPEYFRELAALIAKGPPDEAVVHEIMLRHGLVPAG
jgi:quercetin dioxygenase-like cupin family protein